MHEAAYREPGNQDLHNELHLWACVIEMAVNDFVHGKDQAKNEARAWIFCRDRASAFNTFESLCDILDLDPDAVRDRLVRLKPETYLRLRMAYKHSDMRTRSQEPARKEDAGNHISETDSAGTGSGETPPEVPGDGLERSAG